MKHDLKALRDLEKRLAEAKGPDREIDGAIAHAFERPWPGYKHTAADDNLRAPGGAWICQDGSTTTLICANEYTASLDAAVALVERVLGDGLLDISGTWEPKDRAVHPAWSIRWYRFNTDRDGKGWLAATAGAPTPALALCLACVRALIAQGEVTS